MTTIALAPKAHRSQIRQHGTATQLLIAAGVAAAALTALATLRLGLGGTGGVVPAGPQDVPPASIEILSEMNQPEPVVIVEAQPEPLVSTPPASLDVLSAMNATD